MICKAYNNYNELHICEIDDKSEINTDVIYDISKYINKKYTNEKHLEANKLRTIECYLRVDENDFRHEDKYKIAMYAINNIDYNKLIENCENELNRCIDEACLNYNIEKYTNKYLIISLKNDIMSKYKHIYDNKLIEHLRNNTTNTIESINDKNRYKEISEKYNEINSKLISNAIKEVKNKCLLYDSILKDSINELNANTRNKNENELTIKFKNDIENCKKYIEASFESNINIDNIHYKQTESTKIESKLTNNSDVEYKDATRSNFENRTDDIILDIYNVVTKRHEIDNKNNDKVISFDDIEKTNRLNTIIESKTDEYAVNYETLQCWWWSSLRILRALDIDVSYIDKQGIKTSLYQVFRTTSNDKIFTKYSYRLDNNELIKCSFDYENQYTPTEFDIIDSPSENAPGNAYGVLHMYNVFEKYDCIKYAFKLYDRNAYIIDNEYECILIKVPGHWFVIIKEGNTFNKYDQVSNNNLSITHNVSFIKDDITYITIDGNTGTHYQAAIFNKEYTDNVFEHSVHNNNKEFYNMAYCFKKKL